MSRTDVVVLGGGLNGLAAAVRLARDGRRVTLVEARDAVGGLAAAEEFHPGFRSPGVLHDTDAVSPDLAEALGLPRRGLRFRPARQAAFHGDGAGRVIRVPSEDDASSAPTAPDDRTAWSERAAFLGRVRPFLASILDRAPPPLAPESLAGWMGILGLGVRARRLGEADLLELARVLPMCVADWQNEAFADPLLKAAFAATALEASFLGPWSGGTTALLLLREARAGRGVVGGAPAVVAALAEEAERAGVDVVRGRRATRIVVERGAARAVELDGADPIDAAAVLSTLDPRTTLLDLIEPSRVPPSLADAARVYRMRGTTAKLDLALDGAPPFPDPPGGGPIALYRTGAELDALERAFDAAKYGRCSDPPLLEIHVPTHESPELAPAGRHVASVLVHFAPFALDGGWSDGARERLEAAVLAEFDRHAPGVRDRVVGARLRTPADLAGEFGLTGGHLHHGEHAPDQLLSLRPSFRCGEYRTPIAGLWLGGGGTHPGGGLSGRPGLLAAEALAARS
ncbi:MAG: phytoene desaturase family protein [Planctomycetota bacterium JB042]